MPRLKTNLQGVAWTDRALVVTFTLGELHARRVHDIRIPLELLLDPGFWEKLDKAEARRLRRAWEGDDALPPWQ